MSYGWISRGRRVLGAAALTLGCCGALSAETIIYSNDPAPGDFFTSTEVAPDGAAQALSTPGWYYANVRQDGTVGINTTFAKDGNGSVYFDTTSGAGKADVLYVPGGSLGGTLNDLKTFGYDWLRTDGSTNPGTQAPSLRLILSGTGGLRTLVFEPYYTYYQPDPVPTGHWVSSDAVDGGDALFWQTGDPNQTTHDLTYWQGLYGDYSVVGLSFGVGSGWSDHFTGAVDNVRIGFNGADATVYNFEVVPEPSSVAMGLIAGAAGLAAAARRRRSK